MSKNDEIKVPAQVLEDIYDAMQDIELILVAAIGNNWDMVQTKESLSKGRRFDNFKDKAGALWMYIPEDVRRLRMQR